MEKVSAYSLLTIVLVGMVGCIGSDELEDSITSLSVLAGVQFLPVGESLELMPTGTNQFGDEFSLDVDWEVSDFQVAIVSNANEVLALSPGQVSISAVFKGNRSTPFLLTIIDETVIVAYVTIQGGKTSMLVGESLTLTGLAYNRFDQIVEGKEIEWESSDVSVIEISEGVIKALTNGKSTISAHTEGISSQPLIIEVSEVGLREGSFEGAAGHKAAGKAMLSMANSGVLLELSDDFSADNGPGLYLYLSNQPNNVDAGVEIAPLTKLSGPSSYGIEGVSLADFNYVIIYCKPFKVVVGRAQLN
jgi:hypothetical protein